MSALGALPLHPSWYVPLNIVIRTPKGIHLNPVNYTRITHPGQDPYRVLLDQALTRITKRIDALAAEATDRIEAMYR